MYSILHTSQVLLYHSLTSPEAQPAPTILNLRFISGQINVKSNASICCNNFSYHNVSGLYVKERGAEGYEGAACTGVEGIKAGKMF